MEIVPAHGHIDRKPRGRYKSRIFWVDDLCNISGFMIEAEKCQNIAKIEKKGFPKIQIFSKMQFF